MKKQKSLVTGIRNHAWALELKRPQGDWGPGPHFAGIYNWTAGLPQAVCLRGFKTALFEKRSDARAARGTLFGYGPRRAIVRKVKVALEVLPERRTDAD